MFQPGKTGTYHFRHLALSPPALGSPFRTIHSCTGKIENKSLVEKECPFRAQRATRKQVWHDITTVASKCSTNLVHHNFLLASGSMSSALCRARNVHGTSTFLV